MAKLIILTAALALVASCAAHSNLTESAASGSKFKGLKDLQVGVNLWMTDEQAAEKTYGNITDWDVSEVPDFNHLFSVEVPNAPSFNADISRWITSQATNMHSMFWGATKFNADISKWVTSKVTYMESMFSGATNFNADLSEWDTSKVTSMYATFYQATSFNSASVRDISKWITSQVTDMSWMFAGATNFNTVISAWTTSQVTNMDATFYQATKFNQPGVCKWDHSNLTAPAAVSMFTGSGMPSGCGWKSRR